MGATQPDSSHKAATPHRPRTIRSTATPRKLCAGVPDPTDLSPGHSTSPRPPAPRGTSPDRLEPQPVSPPVPLVVVSQSPHTPQNPPLRILPEPPGPLWQSTFQAGSPGHSNHVANQNRQRMALGRWTHQKICNTTPCGDTNDQVTHEIRWAASELSADSRSITHLLVALSPPCGQEQNRLPTVQVSQSVPKVGLNKSRKLRAFLRPGSDTLSTLSLGTPTECVKNHASPETRPHPHLSPGQR